MTKKSENNAREISFLVLNRVSAGAYPESLIERHLPSLDERDRGLCTELVYGVLRWQIRLDWIIDGFSKIKSGKLEHTVLNALRLGAYQLLFLSKIPPSAAINSSVDLIKREGQKKAGFVNAVLRNIDRQRGSIKYPSEKDAARHISVFYSHPEWLVKRWIERYGVEETGRICKADQQVPPVVLRVNTLLTTREKLINELGHEGYEAAPARYSPDGVVLVSRGRLNPDDPRFYIQDEASQLVSLLLSPKPGERVLDACSAPGGKTTHLAQLMKNKGEIYALDRYQARLRTVRKTASRLGIDIIKTIAADAAEPLPFDTQFDAILIDAPCSGLGVLRRSPDIKLHRKESDIAELSKLQKRILANVSGYLKPGGRLVYSTCTLEPEETDEVVSEFLRENPRFEKEGVCGYLLPIGCSELAGTSGELRTHPQLGVDSFYGARILRMA